jgi:hypothetical protein
MKMQHSRDQGNAILKKVYEEEPVAPRVAEPLKEVRITHDDKIPEDHDMIESQEPPCMTISQKRKLDWVRELIQYAKKYGAPEGIVIPTLGITKKIMS